ncbi:LuxR family transcriptional regulator [Mycolicibacterium moriokaense]|nr:LuxR family transcriptional regulator [Mycolicibacterium moriokaense]
MGVVESLIEAREAFERREWVVTYERLSDLDTAALGGDDFGRLAAAAYLTGRNNDCVQALQRAYQVHLDSDDRLAAVRCAFWLTHTLQIMGEEAIAGGWLARMQRLLGDPGEGSDDGGDTVERGYLHLLQMFRHLSLGEFPAAGDCAAAVTEYGRRFDDADLLAVGLSSEGRFAIYLGQVQRGLTLFDEAMVGVTAGSVSTLFAGEVYCSMIEACQEISDFSRAAQWTLALSRWCDEQPGLVSFTGQCAVHRGQIMRLRGRYPDALQEFSLAIQRYRAAGTTVPEDLALTERGDVLRLLGNLDAADEDYARARQHGYEPQPGQALAWLARGRTAAAAAAMNRLLDEPRTEVGRSRLLPAAVEILLAADDVERAADLVEELTRIAAGFGSTALAAMADHAAGAVAFARGEHGEAISRLRRAAAQWTGIEAPFETARCQVLIGRALRALGDQESAAAELRAAREVFAELGADPATREVDGLLRAAAPAGLTAREAEVLRHVAAGKSNADIADALVLSERTVARHMSNIFTKLQVKSRTAAAAFAFDNNLV